MASSLSEAERQKTAKKMEAICRRMYQLLEVYVLVRSSDNVPHFAVKAAQELLEKPTEKNYAKLLESKEQIWHSFIQVGKLDGLELIASRLARAAWFMTMASSELYQSNLADANPHIETVVGEIKRVKKLLDQEKIRI